MSKAKEGSSPASSPPPAQSPRVKPETINEDELEKEEEQARLANNAAEEKRRRALAKKRRSKKAETKAEREAKARELDELLMKSAAFSDILTKKTQVLGRVGSGLDGQTLGEHDLQMAKQPKCMINGTMRDYQLEGLTWMYEICSQGMSGILADEMGLGKQCTLMLYKLPRLTCPRQNCPDDCSHCSTPRTGRLPRSASHRRPVEHSVQLDGRIREMDAIYSRHHVPWHRRAACADLF